MKYIPFKDRWRGLIVTFKPLWRNRLARSAVNRKVGGSSPPRGVPDIYFLIQNSGLDRKCGALFSELSTSFCGVVVITFALHAKGLRFDPGQKQVAVLISTYFSFRRIAVCWT